MLGGDVKEHEIISDVIMREKKKKKDDIREQSVMFESTVNPPIQHFHHTTVVSPVRRRRPLFPFPLFLTHHSQFNVCAGMRGPEKRKQVFS